MGGVPEVLPSHMINYASPEEDDLVIAVSKSIHQYKYSKVDTTQFNDQLKEMYNWSNVAERTEKVYGSVYQTSNSPLIERLRRYYGCGVYAGKIFCMVIALDYLIWRFLEWLFPTESIEKAQLFPYQKYRQYFQQTNSVAVNSNNANNNNSIIQQILLEEEEEEEEEEEDFPY